MINPVEFIIIIYYITFYHFIYLILSRFYYYIEKYYNIIVNPLLWVIYIIILWFVINYTSVNRSSFYILSFYLITTFSITFINRKNKYFFLLGVMVSLFQSEFWELPIYLYVYILVPSTILITNQTLIYALSSIVKLFTLYEIVLIFKKLNFNHYRLIITLLLFLLPYSVAIMVYYKIHIFYYNIFPTTIYLFIFRFLCSLLFFMIIYRENKFIYDKNIV